MFYKHSEAKAVLWRFRRPHKDTSSENEESANGKTETSVSGFSTFVLMKLTGFYFVVTGGTANIYELQESSGGRSRLLLHEQIS